MNIFSGIDRHSRWKNTPTTGDCSIASCLIFQEHWVVSDKWRTPILNIRDPLFARIFLQLFVGWISTSGGTCHVLARGRTIWILSPRRKSPMALYVLCFRRPNSAHSVLSGVHSYSNVHSSSCHAAFVIIRIVQLERTFDDDATGQIIEYFMTACPSLKYT